MSRGWRIGIGVVVTLIAVNALLAAVDAATGGSPGGPTSSSYASGSDGLGAYAELLAREQHPVERIRTSPHATELDPRATVVLLDAPFVERRDGLALQRFVSRGGRLIAGGSNTGWLHYLLTRPPRSAFGGDERARPLAPVPEVAGVDRIVAAGEDGWATTGDALPIAGGGTTALVALAELGSGRLVLLADASPLQNRLLGAADNAVLALALAGEPRRPVLFLESYHGYGQGRGLGAVPFRWWLLLGGLVLAALTFMVARGRRLGPAEPEGRELPPPRREYVDALGAILARTRRRADAVEPVRAAARARLATRAGLANDASTEAMRHAAAELGLAPDETAAVLDYAESDADVLAAGRALARLESTRRSG